MAEGQSAEGHSTDGQSTGRQLAVEIADWTGRIWQGMARFFVAPTTEGEIGVYARHEPFLAILREGDARVITVSGEQVTVRLSGGFLSVDSDIVTVVADEAELLAPAS
jgi:F-type H+-transporting ATPase subunit epsilon